MDISLLSNNYSVRRLDYNDADSVYEMSRRNTLFYQYHPPFVTEKSILEDMEALPPGKTMEDKYYIGFFNGTRLVANMDLILSYPTKETAFIGLFMVDVSCQHQGIGTEIISEVCGCLKASGFEKIRLGADKGNPQSYAFWKKNQFHAVSEEIYILMERVL